MLRVTKLTDYASLVLTVLASAPERVHSAAELAERAHLEVPTVSKLLKSLAQAGLVEGFRGSNGGYRLARPATAISLGEVLSAIDGPDAPPRDESRPASRALTKVWEHVRAAEKAVLDRTSIAQLAELASPHDWVI